MVVSCFRLLLAMMALMVTVCSGLVKTNCRDPRRRLKAPWLLQKAVHGRLGTTGTTDPLLCIRSRHCFADRIALAGVFKD